VMGRTEGGENLGLRQTDSSGDNSDDNVVTVPTAKGGRRRKHHRAWTLVEVMKLVVGVSKCVALGGGLRSNDLLLHRIHTVHPLI